MERMLKDASTVAPSTEALQGLTTLAQEHATLSGRIEKGEALLKELKARRELLEATLLPQALEAARVTSFKTTDGLAIESTEIVSGSLSEPKRVAGIKWLREHGHAGLVKTFVSVQFMKGQEELAVKARAALTKLGVEVDLKESVHAETLKAWARECLKAGVKFPADMLGLYVGTRATVKQSRKD